MSEFALAAVLGGTILLASTISVEVGLSVALIELAGGLFIGNAFHPAGSGLVVLHRSVRGNRPDIPRRGRGRRSSVPA